MSHQSRFRSRSLQERNQPRSPVSSWRVRKPTLTKLIIGLRSLLQQLVDAVEVASVCKCNGETYRIVQDVKRF